MSHPLLKAAIRLFCTSILLLAPAKIVSACWCQPTPTVLDAYEAADAVVIVRVLSVQDLRPKEPTWPTIGTNVLMPTVRVERVFKGNLKVNEQVTLVQNLEGNCSWSFNEAEINSEMLFYLKAPANHAYRWTSSSCGRTKPLAQATDDLLYLDNMEKVRGKTRVSGKYDMWVNKDIALANRPIRIVSEGTGKVYDLATDGKGVFEIYDLPAGRYRLEPEIPQGWRIDRKSLEHSVSTKGRQPLPKAVKFVLSSGKHAGVNFAFQPDNAVEGSIVGPQGKPLVNTCVYLRRPEDLNNRVSMVTMQYLPQDCTDANGRFRIESVKPGTYFLLLNAWGKPRSHEPFPTVFHPGTTELDKATKIEIGLGQTVSNINVAVPVLLDTITVKGVLRRSDGLPVPKQEVRFESVENPELDGLAITQTDERGRFSLKILKGLQGTVYGGMSVVAGTFHCPELKSLNYGPQDRVYVRTKEIKIEAVKDLNLDLHLLYPDCTRK
jgi:hypothetical protein